VGYRTGLFGKYLNEYSKISPTIPPGWDDFQAFATEAAYYNYKLNENGAIVNYGSVTSAYSTDVLASKATQFIWATPTEQPLFLLFVPYAPHAPATPYPSDVGVYATVPKWRPPSFNEPDVTDKPAWIRALKKITDAQMATSDALHQRQLETLLSVDRAVASIVSALQLNGRWGSTLVIFASDNGYAWGEHRLVDRKNCPYEECIRVPIWVRAPGLVARTDTNLVANIDLAPTIAAWAGTTPPGKVNGMNLLPLLESPFTPWRSALLIEHWGGPQTSSGVRTSRYLYNEYANGNKEFYDLALDPYQRTSRHTVAANKPLIASLKAMLTELKGQ
jgi:arylsulfatase A-like enzyme